MQSYTTGVPITQYAYSVHTTMVHRFFCDTVYAYSWQSGVVLAHWSRISINEVNLRRGRLVLGWVYIGANSVGASVLLSTHGEYYVGAKHL